MKDFFPELLRLSFLILECLLNIRENKNDWVRLQERSTKTWTENKKSCFPNKKITLPHCFSLVDLLQVDTKFIKHKQKTYLYSKSIYPARCSQLFWTTYLLGPKTEGKCIQSKKELFMPYTQCSLFLKVCTQKRLQTVKVSCEQIKDQWNTTGICSEDG